MGEDQPRVSWERWVRFGGRCQNYSYFIASQVEIFGRFGEEVFIHNRGLPAWVCPQLGPLQSQQKKGSTGPGPLTGMVRDSHKTHRMRPSNGLSFLDSS